jgi:hypothetical protein
MQTIKLVEIDFDNGVIGYIHKYSALADNIVIESHFHDVSIPLDVMRVIVNDLNAQVDGYNSTITTDFGSGNYVVEPFPISEDNFPNNYASAFTFLIVMVNYISNRLAVTERR